MELDVHTHRARSGDLYLICSDGLTSMVREARLREILTESESLRSAVDALVAEANEMGGRDNITVVLFRVGGEGEDADHDGAAPSTRRSWDCGRRSRRPTPVNRKRCRCRPPRNRLSLLLPPRRTAAAARTFRRALLTLVVLAVLAGAVVAAVAVIRNVYFVGQDDRGLVTLYRGVPYELPLGIDLYESQYVSSVPARTLSPTQRRRQLDHQLRSREDAADIVRELERGRQ